MPMEKKGKRKSSGGGGIQSEKKPRRFDKISAAAGNDGADTLHVNFSLQVAKRVLQVDPAAALYENMICSPLSISAVLSVLASGSGGKTREQLLRVMEHDSVDEVNDVASRLAEVLKGDDDKDAPDISFANGLWVDHRWRLKETFRKVLNDVHYAHAEAVDFNQVDRVVKDANLWAEKHTKGFIKQILSRHSITKYTTMILSNALYFKGVWVETFKPEDTKDHDFYLLNGDKIRAPFMKKWRTLFEYGTLEGCKVLKMPYKKGDRNAIEGENPRSFSMYIFLPDDYDGLPNLMENIKIDSNLFKGQTQLKRVEISKLWIPTFNFDCDLSLSDPMRQLGLTLPFDGTGCDLTGMVEDTFTGDRPYVGEILQKCRIETNEKGTKAAAFIGVLCYEASPPCLKQPPSINFVANHPFMFMIREDCSGTILFVGTVLDPTSG